MTLQHARPVPVWTIIIPVKDTRFAKTRLSPLGQPVRARLALAFALDAVSAALASPVVRRVLVVTNDAEAGDALAGVGATVTADAPDAGLNPAIVHGSRVARTDEPEAWVAAMSGDLPALRAEDLTEGMAAADGLAHWFVPDSIGVGTTLLAATGGTRLSPAFGPQSRAGHLALGAVEVTGNGLERLRRDVDTEADLWEAVRLGVGPFTAAALAELQVTRGLGG